MSTFQVIYVRTMVRVLISKGSDTFWQYLFLRSEDISHELFASFTHTGKYYVDVGWDENMRQR